MTKLTRRERDQMMAEATKYFAQSVFEHLAREYLKYRDGTVRWEITFCGQCFTTTFGKPEETDK